MTFALELRSDQTTRGARLSPGMPVYRGTRAFFRMTEWRSAGRCFKRIKAPCSISCHSRHLSYPLATSGRFRAESTAATRPRGLGSGIAPISYRDFGHVSTGNSGRDLTSARLRTLPGFRALGYREPGQTDTGRRDTQVPGFRAHSASPLPGVQAQSGDATARTHSPFPHATLFFLTLAKPQQPEVTPFSSGRGEYEGEFERGSDPPPW